ncbi:MAG TPA: response regulator transcription factor [Verrucomicrobiae bacterium]|nr:response regulator transcription factor [Verrucomicrobiae bacterium]
MNAVKTVIVADDHPLFRTALREALKPVLPGARVVEADSFPALQNALATHGAPDLILLDLNMPGVRGFSSLLFLRSEYPTVPVVVVSGYDEAPLIQRVLQFGARGFIPKTTSLEIMGEAVRAVLNGSIWTPEPLPPPASDAVDAEIAAKVASLSPQQLRVLLMLADGRLNKQIAHELSITEATVKAHMTVILRKLGLARRTQAAVLAQRLMHEEALPLAVDNILDEGGPDDPE